MNKNYRWIASVYIMQGLPFGLVTAVAPILYKSFGFSNTKITFYTSLFALPWVIKFFLAPPLEKLAAKRTLTLAMQFLVSGCTLLLIGDFYFTNWFYYSGTLFLLIAFISAIHDISSDGLYLERLNHQEQAKFIGIRSLCYQVGKLICQGGLIFIIGYFTVRVGKEKMWQIGLISLAICIFLIAVYNKKNIPVQAPLPEETETSTHWRTLLATYQITLTKFRALPHLISISIFILSYQFASVQLNKILPLFMLDKIAQGGLGLNVAVVGMIDGGIGIGSMLIGVTLSGYLLARYSLKKCLIPVTLFVFFGNLSYLFLKLSGSHSLGWITFCVMIAEFGFGLGNGTYMLYLIKYFAKGRYSMSLYAMGTAIMQLGMICAGGISGYLQSCFGYTGFFIWVSVIEIGILGVAIYNQKWISAHAGMTE